MTSHMNEEFGPVKVVTPEDIAAQIEENRASLLQDPNVVISPLGDDSVQGYPGDKVPKWNGIQEVKAAVRILEEFKIPCCFVAEPALIYYGTGRIMTVCTLFYSYV